MSITKRYFLPVLVTSLVLAVAFGAPDGALAQCSPTELQDGSVSSFEEDVDQWDDDVLNFTVSDPGAVIAEAEGAKVEGPFTMNSNCGSDLSPGSGELFVEAGGSRAVSFLPGDYTLVLSPQGIETGGYRVRLHFVSACKLRSADDYADGTLCADEVTLTSDTDGELDIAADRDVFALELASQQTVTFETTGSVDTEGSLYDEDGGRIATDDDSGTGTNFQIVETLDAGRYFVRVEGYSGDTGLYTLSVD